MIRALILAAGLALVACTPELDTIGEGTPPPGEFLVPVRLSNFEIEVAETPPTGELTFQIENEADQRHALAIEGNGIDETLTAGVAPGSIETVTIELEPGTYTVWCPIGDHRQRGMETELTVTERTQKEGGAPPEAIEPSDLQDEIDDEGS